MWLSLNSYVHWPGGESPMKSHKKNPVSLWLNSIPTATLNHHRPKAPTSTASENMPRCMFARAWRHKKYLCESQSLGCYFDCSFLRMSWFLWFLIQHLSISWVTFFPVRPMGWSFGRDQHTMTIAGELSVQAAAPKRKKPSPVRHDTKRVQCSCW